ncbi:MAG: YHS domain-containing protein [Planctomycetota bacterium]|jgi:YHS domain-containing protein
MNSKKKRPVTVLLFAIVVLIGVVTLSSCKKEPEPGPPPESAAQAVAVSIEQTTCPIMGQAINKDVFVEYKGKKVYFCCAGCEQKFNADPEKYVAKLPQFKD